MTACFTALTDIELASSLLISIKYMAGALQFCLSGLRRMNRIG